LQSENPGGGFVVINGTEISGVWQSRTDAIKAGIEKYGNVSFLVKDINESPTRFNFSRNIAFAVSTPLWVSDGKSVADVMV